MNSQINIWKWDTKEVKLEFDPLRISLVFPLHRLERDGSIDKLALERTDFNLQLEANLARLEQDNRQQKLRRFKQSQSPRSRSSLANLSSKMKEDRASDCAPRDHVCQSHLTNPIPQSRTQSVQIRKDFLIYFSERRAFLFSRNSELNSCRF